MDTSGLRALWERYKPKCKVAGGIVGAAVVAAVQAVGVDLASVVHDVAGVIGVNPPDEAAVATGIGALAVAYLIPEDFCTR